MNVEYPYRLLLDYEFVNELAKGPVFDSRQKYDVLHWLMYIKASSSTNKGDHNVMTDGEFKRVIDNKVMREDELRKIVKPISLPEEFNFVKNIVDRNLIAAVTTTGSPPWSCIIFTSKNEEKNYKASRTYKKLQDVKVQSGDDSYQSIKLMFNLYSSQNHI